jgi:hypothetical protein
MMSVGGNVEQRIAQLQARFDNAELNGDRDTLRELIASDFLSIGPKGFVLDKEQWINRHDLFTYSELSTSEMDIRVYEGAVIVRDVQRNKADYDANHVEVNTRVSHIWVQQQGRWQLAGIQFSPLAEVPASESEAPVAR